MTSFTSAGARSEALTAQQALWKARQPGLSNERKKLLVHRARRFWRYARRWEAMIEAHKAGK